MSEDSFICENIGKFIKYCKFWKIRKIVDNLHNFNIIKVKVALKQIINNIFCRYVENVILLGHCNFYIYISIDLCMWYIHNCVLLQI